MDKEKLRSYAYKIEVILERAQNKENEIFKHTESLRGILADLEFYYAILNKELYKEI